MKLRKSSVVKTGKQDPTMQKVPLIAQRRSTASCLENNMSHDFHRQRFGHGHFAAALIPLLRVSAHRADEHRRTRLQTSIVFCCHACNL